MLLDSCRIQFALSITRAKMQAHVWWKQQVQMDIVVLVQLDGLDRHAQ